MHSSARTTLSPAMTFEFHPRTRLIVGANGIERVGVLARELGASRVLLVTDRGLVQAGHAQRVRDLLAGAGLAVAIFEGAEENPTTLCVDRCVGAAQAAHADLLVGLGGGSALDTAKGCNFILTNGGQMKDYWGVGKASKPMLPFIAVPTTAGTGSECQSAALIADAETHQKMACLDPKAAARIAILDPVLTLSQPPRVTALTGLDAIAHAVESAVTIKRNALSQMFSREAFRHLLAGYEAVLRHPSDLAARSSMQWGSALAGLAVEHSMLGAAHSAANPLTARHGLVHGQAVGMMLPWVVRFNSEAPEAAETYADLGRAGDLTDSQVDPRAAGELLAKQLDRLLDLAQVPRSLADGGVEKATIPRLAEEAAKQWTAAFNPRPISAEDFVRLYETAWRGR